MALYSIGRRSASHAGKPGSTPGSVTKMSSWCNRQTRLVQVQYLAGSSPVEDTKMPL